MQPRYMDFRALKRLARMEDVLELIGWQENFRRGQQLRGKCPLHESANLRSRSFSVNLERKIWQCFKCRKGGDLIDLVREKEALTTMEAAIAIANYCNLTEYLFSGKTHQHSQGKTT